jgi:hypothetical protein
MHSRAQAERPDLRTSAFWEARNIYNTFISDRAATSVRPLPVPVRSCVTSA